MLGQEYREEDYLYGRIKLPPPIMAKRQKAYAYSDQITISNGSTGRIDLVMDADSCFLVEGIEAVTADADQAADDMKIQITDNTFSMPWSNVPLFLRDVAGTGAYMHELPYPNMLVPTNTLTIFFENNTGASQTVYLTLHGRKFYDVNDEEIALLKRRMWFQYGLAMPTISTTLSTFNLQIYNESDFFIRYMLSWSIWQDILEGSVGEVRVNFRDTSQDRNFYSQLLALRTVVGCFSSIYNAGSSNYSPINQTGQFRYNKGVYIRRNAVIQASVIGGGTGDTGNILTFEGARVFGAA